MQISLSGCFAAVHLNQRTVSLESKLWSATTHKTLWWLQENKQNVDFISSLHLLVLSMFS